MMKSFFKKLFHCYAAAGYFKVSDPVAKNYRYANWGSRPWEYRYVETLLKKGGLAGKAVLDIGIGLPADSDFYRFYVNSECTLIGVDPDQRLPEVTELSERCRIVRAYAAEIDLPLGSVDYVVAISSLEHFPVDAFYATLRHIHGILKDDGVFLVTLDMTIDRDRPARWAILEKTCNGLPEGENDLCLGEGHRQIDLAAFLVMVADFFVLNDESDMSSVTVSPKDVTGCVHNAKWNSVVGYVSLKKAAPTRLGR